MSYIIKRVLVTIPIVFGVLTITFLLSRAMPGDPVMMLLNQAQIRYTPEIYNSFARELGLNLPLYLQFFRYIGDIFTGNWGQSIGYAPTSDVWELIIFRLPKTLDLTFFSMLIASYLGVKIGIISATHRNKFRDTVFRSLGIVGVAFPVFVLGMLLQFWLGFQLNLLPSTSYKNADYADPPFITGFYMIDALISGNLYLIPDYLYHLAMPVFCLSFVTLAGIIRQTRSSMLVVLQEDYIRTARAKGCIEKDVIRRHALRNSMIPTVTVIGLNFATTLAGAVLLESTFNLRGIGLLLIDATLYRDYWLLNACMVVVALIYIITILVIDILYGFIDPRIRY
ncbi:MAG: ABC transporter permease [Promethearchaeota archaeon]